MPDLSGLSIGRYHIIEPLGEGGMAVVYKGFDTRLEREVAVKFIRVDRLSPAMLGQALKRFEREAKEVAGLTHSNIVPVTDYGEFEGTPYLVMKYIPGGTLKAYLDQRGQLPWQEAVNFLIPIIEALGYAHSEGIIHRDVKPSNILLTQNRTPMLTDFGVAKIIEEDTTQGLTGTNAAIGTPEYMAPEQVASKNVDARADLYALGVVFYEMVTGRRPFEADTPLAVLFKHASEPLPKPSLYVKNLPQGVENFLYKALAKKPEDRFQTAQEMIESIKIIGNQLDNQQKRKQETLVKSKNQSKIKEPKNEKTIYQQKDEELVRQFLNSNYHSFKKKLIWILVGVLTVSLITFTVFLLPKYTEKPAVIPETTNTIIVPSPTLTPSSTHTMVPSQTSTITLTPFPTETTTPDPNQVLLKPVSGSVHCYLGPNTQIYDKSGFISEEVTPLGLDKTKKWVKVNNSQIPQVDCWVMVNAFTISGDLNHLTTLPDPEITNPVLFYVYLQSSDHIWWSMPVGNFQSYGCAASYGQSWLDYCKISNINNTSGNCGNLLWINNQDSKYYPYTGFVVNKYVESVYSNAHFSKLSYGSCFYSP